MSAAKQANGNGHAAVEDEPPPVSEAPPKGADLRQRVDQLGTILAKGLDLAEAGVSLGVTIISRVGVAAQQKIQEGLAEAAASAQPAPSPEAQAEQPQAEPEYGLTNRLPLTPGGAVRISFSVNNDSLTEQKKVELRVEGFAGDTQGGHLDPAQFSINPARKTIAPVDFEKFVLQGSVPADTPPDIYRGAVVVESGSPFRIPVVLVVMPL